MIQPEEIDDIDRLIAAEFADAADAFDSRVGGRAPSEFVAAARREESRVTRRRVAAAAVAATFLAAVVWRPGWDAREQRDPVAGPVVTATETSPSDVTQLASVELELKRLEQRERELRLEILKLDLEVAQRKRAAAQREQRRQRVATWAKVQSIEREAGGLLSDDVRRRLRETSL